MSLKSFKSLTTQPYIVRLCWN